MKNIKCESILRTIISLHVFRIFIVILILSMVAAGCATNSSPRVKETAGSGAAIGAGLGFLIGALSGKPEKAAAGILVGAAVGAGEGAYEGWKQEQDDQRTRQLVEAVKESRIAGAQLSDTRLDNRAREELTRFLGIWTMEGWLQEPGGERLTVKAKVNGDVEMGYFVELAYVDIEIPGMKTQIWGTSMLGYGDDEGYNITTRFNTLPEPLRITGGSFSAASRTFTFSENNTRIVVSFKTPDLFTAETFIKTGGSEQQVEFYRFTRS